MGQQKGRLRVGVATWVLWLAASLIGLPAARAFPTPGQPIRLIVPLPAGGMGDVHARAIAAKLSQNLSVPVIVENRPGASTVIATMDVVRAAPNGQTLLFTFGATAITNPVFMTKLPYQVDRDLKPVILVAKSGLVLIVNGKLPYENLPQLINFARKNPGKLSCGSTGLGSISHLSCEILKGRANVDITHVPFNGSSDAETALLGGHIDMLFDAPLGAFQIAKSGRVKMLGIADTQRYDAAPGVPTMAEQGIVGTEILGGFQVFGPAKMPPGLTVQLNKEFARVIRDPEVARLLLDSAQVVAGGPPEQLHAFVKEQSAQVAEFSKRTGFRLDP